MKKRRRRRAVVCDRIEVGASVRIDGLHSRDETSHVNRRFYQFLGGYQRFFEFNPSKLQDCTCWPH